jgi:hypothetical protein
VEFIINVFGYGNGRFIYHILKDLNKAFQFGKEQRQIRLKILIVNSLDKSDVVENLVDPLRPGEGGVSVHAFGRRLGFSGFGDLGNGKIERNIGA